VRHWPIGAGVGITGLGYWAAFRPSSQVFGRFPFHAEDIDPVIALTFDDGPNEPYTSRLLTVLAERDVRATFFVVGRCAERYPATVRAVVESGHVLGNHSYSHSFSRYLTMPTQRIEIRRGQDCLAAIAGLRPGLYRPPWLCHWPWVLGSVRAAGLQPVSGRFGHPLEIFQPPARRIAATAARVARPGAILIFHDGFDARGGARSQTVAAVGPLIDTLRDRGYRFATVDEMLGVPPYLNQEVSRVGAGRSR
jgi:peptidoglycan-N-acetylglucosamine deacetylase